MTYDLDRLAAREKAATPGPWIIDNTVVKVMCPELSEGATMIIGPSEIGTGTVHHPEIFASTVFAAQINKEDAELIASLRNAAPALLATARKYEEMQELVERVIKEVDAVWEENIKTGGVDVTALASLHHLSSQLAALVGKEPTT